MGVGGDLAAHPTLVLALVRGGSANLAVGPGMTVDVCRAALESSTNDSVRSVPSSTGGA